MPNSRHLLDEFFPALTGRWRLNRSISTGGRFSGTADFVKSSNGNLLLKEQGELVLTNGSRCMSFRTWLWENAGRDLINIYFDETPRRLYHRLEFQSGSAVLTAIGNHMCGKDRYQGHYRLGSSQLIIRQDVKGPAKDYSIESIYARTASIAH